MLLLLFVMRRPMACDGNPEPSIYQFLASWQQHFQAFAIKSDDAICNDASVCAILLVCLYGFFWDRGRRPRWNRL